MHCIVTKNPLGGQAGYTVELLPTEPEILSYRWVTILSYKKYRRAAVSVFGAVTGIRTRDLHLTKDVSNFNGKWSIRKSTIYSGISRLKIGKYSGFCAVNKKW